MNAADREKLFQIRCRTKRGETVSSEEIKFCERMLRLYPEEYSGMSDEVFKRTAPFGSVQSME